MSIQLQPNGRRGEPAWLPWLFVVAAMVFTIAIRLVPRLVSTPAYAVVWWQLVPMGALGLFAGARLRSWAAWLAPLVAAGIADLLLIPLLPRPLHYSIALTPFVYASYLLYVALGRCVEKAKGPSAFLAVAGGALAGSVQFFLITNFAAWLGDKTYPSTIAGLVESYWAGLPFWKNTVVGDLLYTAFFFGLYHAAVWAYGRETARQPA
jgi:hypothetical protein